MGVDIIDDVFAPLLTAAISFLATTGFLLLFVFALWLCSDSGGVQLGTGLPGAYDDAEQFFKDEQAAIAAMTESQRASYYAAKAFADNNPPNSCRSELTIAQYLTIQEQGVSAWEFPYNELEAGGAAARAMNRTEIEFTGPEACIQTNLPLPTEREVYYFEAKLYELPPSSHLSIGLATKPYPPFRLPGMHRFSVAYDSNGNRRLNQPFDCPSYGRAWQQGDVVGVGFRPRSGVVFFTHNGKKLPDVVQGMRFNLFPSLGAVGGATVHVNFGAAGFVFIEANVKKWGLAPAQGSLMAPPAYGDQSDSVLLNTSQDAVRRPPSFRSHNSDPPAYIDGANMPSNQGLEGLGGSESSEQRGNSGTADIGNSHLCRESETEQCISEQHAIPASPNATANFSNISEDDPPPPAPPKPSLQQVLAEAMKPRP